MRVLLAPAQLGSHNRDLSISEHGNGFIWFPVKSHERRGPFPFGARLNELISSPWLLGLLRQMPLGPVWVAWLDGGLVG